MENDELFGHDGMKKTPPPWKFAGTVSYGDSDVDVITERVLAVLREMGVSATERRERESEASYFNRLCSIANAECPDDYYFGLAYGENNHWGYWELPF